MIPHNPMLNEFLALDHQTRLVEEARRHHLLREARAARTAQRLARRQERAEAKARRAAAKARQAAATAASIPSTDPSTAHLQP